MKTCDVLFIRMDKLGDLILSLPVDQQPELADLNTHWFVSQNMNFVLNQSVKSRNFTEFNKDDLGEFKKMRQWLRENKPQVAVLFYAPWWVSLALFLERVPVRVGRHSQWHSYLFFNKGLRQKRSRGEKHELEYNIELLKTHFKSVRFDPNNSLQFKAPENRDTLEKFHLKERGYIIVHPGMAGSALNWPMTHYIELCERLRQNFPVVITGTPSDKEYIDPIKAHFKERQNIIFTDGQCSGSELIQLCQFAKAVVAPSTGVVHIAASSGVKTIGLYSPIATQNSTRWGALGAAVVNIEAKAHPHIETSMTNIRVDDVLKHLL